MRQATPRWSKTRKKTLLTYLDTDSDWDPWSAAVDHAAELLLPAWADMVACSRFRGFDRGSSLSALALGAADV